MFLLQKQVFKATPWWFPDPNQVFLFRNLSRTTTASREPLGKVSVFLGFYIYSGVSVVSFNLTVHPRIQYGKSSLRGGGWSIITSHVIICPSWTQWLLDVCSNLQMIARKVFLLQDRTKGVMLRRTCGQIQIQIYFYICSFAYSEYVQFCITQLLLL